MPAVTISNLLRRLGNPSIETDSATGLLRIERRYRVDISGIEIANLESEVLASIGDTDTEYTNAYLVDQKIEGLNDESGPVLIRTFQELDSGAGLTESGDGLIERLDNNLYRVTRVFLGLKDSADDLGNLDDEVGVETYSIPGLTPEVSVTLANWRREVIDDTVVKYTKVYQQPGIIRVTINEKFGKSPHDPAGEKAPLIEYTVMGFMIEDSDVTATLLGDPFGDGVTKPAGPFDVSKDNYHGFDTTVLRYVYGMGIISASQSAKTGASNTVVEHILVSINIPPSEFLLAGNTYTGVQALGATKTYDENWLGVVALNSLSTDARDDYIIYTARYIQVDGAAAYVGGTSGGGTTTVGTVNVATEWSSFAIPADAILSDQTSLEYGGNVEVRRMSFVADLSSGDDLDTLLGAAVTIGTELGGETYAVVDVGTQAYPGYVIGTFTMARGSGIVSVTRDERFADVRPGEDGGVVHQVTAINLNPKDAGVFDQGGRTYDFTDGKVISSTVKDTQYGPLYTMEIYDGAAITGLSTTFKYDGNLEITTITGLNLNPLDVYGDQYGTVADHEVTVNQYGTQYKYIFARGEGEILRNTTSRYDQQVLVTTVKSLNVQPEVPAGAYLVSTQIDNDKYGDIFTYVWAEGSGLVSVEEESRYNGVLTIYTVRTINETPNIPTNAYVINQKFEEGDYGELYTTRYAEGRGLMQTSEVTRYDGNLVITTVEYLNELPPIPGGAYLMQNQTESSDYGTVYTARYAQGSGELETRFETRYNGRLRLYTTVWLNQVPQLPNGSNVVTQKVESADYGTIYTYQYTDGLLAIELSRSVRYLYDGQLAITKVESLNKPLDIPGSAYEMTQATRDGTYGTVYTVEYAEGSGLIDTHTEGRYLDESGEPTLTIITQRYLNTEAIVPPGVTLISRSHEDGNYGYVNTIKYATGEGELFSGEETRYDGKITIHTKKWLNVPPPVPPDATIISMNEESSDYGTIYTYKWAVGEPGFLDETVSYRYNGDLKITRRSYLGQLPPEPGTGEILVDFDQKEGQYGIVYTQTVAEGTGEISSSVTQLYGGILQLVTKRFLNRVEENLVTSDKLLVSEEYQDNTHGTLITVQYVEGPGGLIDSTEESRHGGALTITTERWIKQIPKLDGRVLMSSSVDSTKYGDITTYRFAEGSGSLSSTVEDRFGGTLRIITATWLNEKPVLGDDAAVLSYSVREESYGTLYNFKFAEGLGLLTSETVTRFGGVLRITTDRYLNTSGNVPSNAYLMSSEVRSEDFGTVYEYVYAQGEGEIHRSTTERYFSTTTGTNLLEVLTIKSLNTPPATPSGYTLVKAESSLEAHGTVYTHEFAQGQGVLGESRAVKLANANGEPVVETITVRSLNSLPTAAELGLSPSARLVQTQENTGDYGTTYTQVFTDGKGWLSTSENFPYPDRPDIVIYTVRHANEEPQPPSNVSNPRNLGSRLNEGSEVTIYTGVYAVGSGLIGESSNERYNGQVKVNTYRFLAGVDDTVIVGNVTKEEVSVGQYGDIFTVTAVELAPPFILTESHTEVMPGIIRHTLLTLVEAPSDYAGTSGGVVTEISTDVSQSELGTQYRTTFIEAINGTEVSTSTSQQANGVETVTVVVVGPVNDPRIPSGTFLTDLRQDEKPGYILTTYQYLKPPNNYTLTSERTIQYPGFVQADSDTIQGYRVVRAPAMETVSSTIEVEFTDTPPTSIDNSALLNPRAFISVRVSGTAGPNDPTGHDSYHTRNMSGFWASNTRAFYDARYPTTEGFAVQGSSTVEGTPSQMGATLILGRVVVPFFFSGGTQIYKVTTETISL